VARITSSPSEVDESRNAAPAAYREGVTNLYKLLEARRASNEARPFYFRIRRELQAALAELAFVADEEETQ
jgi:hypothetical protein